MVIKRFSFVLVSLFAFGCMHPDQPEDAGIPGWLQPDFSVTADGMLGDAGSSTGDGSSGTDLSGAIDGPSTGGDQAVTSDSSIVDLSSSFDFASVDFVPPGPPPDVVIQIQGAGKTVTRNASDVTSPEFVVTALTGWYQFGGLTIKHGGTGSLQGVVSARLYWKEANISFGCKIDWNQNLIYCLWQPSGLPRNQDMHFVLYTSYGWNQADGTHIYDVPDAASVHFVENNLKIGGVPVNNPAKVTITVVPKGELFVLGDGPPFARILLGGAEELMHRIQICTWYEDAIVDLLNVTALGRSSYKHMFVVLNGTPRGLRVVPGGDKNEVDLYFDNRIIFVPADKCVTGIEVYGQLLPVTGWFQANGMGNISGMALALGITAGKTDGEWDGNYVGKFNVRATGTITKSRLYADAPQGTLYNPENLTPPLSTLRKSKPMPYQVVCPNQQQGVPVPLIGDVETFCWVEFANQAGEIGMHKRTFTFTTGLQGQDHLDLTCRLRQGVSELQPGQVKLVDCNGKDVSGGTWVSTQNCKQISVVPTNRVPVNPGQAIAFGMRCTVGGLLQKGDSLNVQVYHPETLPVTGQIAGDLVVNGQIVSPAPNLLVNGQIVAASNIYDDGSDLPTGPKSHDHFSSAQIEGLTGSVTLIRP